MLADFSDTSAMEHQKDPRSILECGDGSARFAIDFRKAHPDATLWEIVDAVSEYRRNNDPRLVAPEVENDDEI